MEISDLVRRNGQWLSGTGELSDVVISSRIRLARNLQDHVFFARAGESERREIYRHLTEHVVDSQMGDDCLVVNLEEVEALDRELLVERQLISRQHAAAEGCRGAVISADETRTIMVNEEDHLRIQCLRGGMRLESLWNEIAALDDAIERRVTYAFDERLGYLTACPTNLGTGIRVSVMLHLPALKLTNEIERLFAAARDMRLAVRGLYGEGTEAIGDFFQVSNQTTLGRGESEIVEDFTRNIIPRLVEYEIRARQQLASERPYQLDDKIWRAYGALCHARTIGTEEALFLLSNLRMGVQTKRFKMLPLSVVNELSLLVQRAHLQKVCGRVMDGEHRSIARAELIRARLASGK